MTLHREGKETISIASIVLAVIVLASSYLGNWGLLIYGFFEYRRELFWNIERISWPLLMERL